MPLDPDTAALVDALEQLAAGLIAGWRRHTGAADPAILRLLSESFEGAPATPGAWHRIASAEMMARMAEAWTRLHAIAIAARAEEGPVEG